MEAARWSETPVYSKPTRSHIPEDAILRSHPPWKPQILHKEKVWSFTSSVACETDVATAGPDLPYVQDDEITWSADTLVPRLEPCSSRMQGGCWWQRKDSRDIKHINMYTRTSRENMLDTRHSFV
jgi:hypothetical protein